jgi:hypothetical protein
MYYITGFFGQSSYFCGGINADGFSWWGLFLLGETNIVMMVV